jgi:hypothetical protein
MAGMFDGLDWSLVERLQAAERERGLAQTALSEAILALSPFKKNDIVRDKDTGARYRIASGSGYLNSGRPSMLLVGYRVYTTGRREATSSSHLDAHRLEKVEE